MNRPLRTRHRVMVLAVALVTGVVLIAALAARAPIPTTELPASITEAPR